MEDGKFSKDDFIEMMLNLAEPEFQKVGIEGIHEESVNCFLDRYLELHRIFVELVRHPASFSR